jgi:hypothetical protein
LKFFSLQRKVLKAANWVEKKMPSFNLQSTTPKKDWLKNTVLDKSLNSYLVEKYSLG